MPLVSFLNAPAGPIIDVGISEFDPKQVAGQPPSSTVWIKAIADTGASCTCICLNTATAAKLPLIGKALVSSATHSVPTNQYYGTLWIRGMVAGTSFAWNFPGRTFLELGMPSAEHQALLGMDVLSLGMFVVHGPPKISTFAW